jgi:subtilisin family serine protease
MDPRYRAASVSPVRTLTALLTGVFDAVLLLVRMRGVRALPQRLAPRGVLALTLSLVLASAGATAGHNAWAGTLVEDFVPDEVVVKLDVQSGATIEQINAAYDTQVKDTLPGHQGVYLLQIPSGRTLEGVLQDLAGDPRVLYAEPNFTVEPPEADEHGGDARMRARVDGTSPTSSSTQYASSALGLLCAATISSGQGTTVAVIDTGAQLDHPQLAANFEGVKRYDFVGDDPNPADRAVGLDEDGDGLEDELVGHGTHVAGIVDLVAPSAKVMPLRVLDSEGYGQSFTIAKAISYAESNGADVINLSLGSRGKSELLREVVEAAIERGVVVAAAAGNEDNPLPHYPAAGNGTAASADGLVAVTSVDMYEKKSAFASYGTWVDVAAPGENIRSAYPGGKYAYWSGTSMATPFVAGQAALIHTVNGSLGPARIEAKIRNSARPLLLRDLVYAEMLGAGHADVCASLQR